MMKTARQIALVFARYYFDYGPTATMHQCCVIQYCAGFTSDGSEKSGQRAMADAMRLERELGGIASRTRMDMN